MSQPSGPQQPFVVPSDPSSFNPPGPPPRSSNRTLWIVLGVIAAVVLLIGCIGVAVVGTLTVLGQRVEATFDDIDTGLEAEEYVAPTAQPIVAGGAVGLNQLVEAGDLDVTITDVRYSDGNDEVQPEANNEFVVIDMSITNRSRRSLVPYDELYGSWIQESVANTTYACCVYGLEDSTAFDSPISPGATERITVVYEAPKILGNLYWVYEEYYDNKRVAVKLPSALDQ